MERIIHKNKVHEFNTYQSKTVCNVPLDEDEYHFTDKEITCEACIEWNEAFASVAKKHAIHVDNSILDMIVE